VLIAIPTCDDLAQYITCHVKVRPSRVNSPVTVNEQHIYNRYQILCLRCTERDTITTKLFTN